jgi:hypothetical protein
MLFMINILEIFEKLDTCLIRYLKSYTLKWLCIYIFVSIIGFGVADLFLHLYFYELLHYKLYFIITVPVCPHAGGVGLCELVQHLSMFDYISVGTSLENR